MFNQFSLYITITKNISAEVENVVTEDTREAFTKAKSSHNIVI